MEVKAGQVLARLDASQARQALALSESQLEASKRAIVETEAQLKEAKLRKGRIDGLVRTGVSSAAEGDAIEAEVAVLEARLDEGDPRAPWRSAATVPAHAERAETEPQAALDVSERDVRSAVSHAQSLAQRDAAALTLGHDLDPGTVHGPGDTRSARQAHFPAGGRPQWSPARRSALYLKAERPGALPVAPRLKIGLHQSARLEQRLVQSPQMIQAMQILQLPTLDLQERIEQPHDPPFVVLREHVLERLEPFAGLDGLERCCIDWRQVLHPNHFTACRAPEDTRPVPNRAAMPARDEAHLTGEYRAPANAYASEERRTRPCEGDAATCPINSPPGFGALRR